MITFDMFTPFDTFLLQY